MLRRWARKKAEQIEARNWGAVAHLMSPDETKVDYVATVRHFGDGSALGHSYVTDQQLSSPLAHLRLRFSHCHGAACGCTNSRTVPCSSRC